MNFFKLPGSSREELNSIEFQPFSDQLKPIIEESLKEAEKTGRNREGTFFTPIFTVFVILGMAMRHDLSYPKVINWMISAVRWLSLTLPKKIVDDGALTHARQYLGAPVFRLIFDKFNQQNHILTPDFQGRNSVMFDGVTATLPDTLSPSKEVR